MITEAKHSTFAGYHPVINFLYFGYVILVPILFMHPVFLVFSFISALSYSIYLGRKRAVKFGLCFVLPLMVIAALFNPAFNHRGETILFYFHYNPITLEAIIYGACAALMIGGVILWFTCYNAIMTSDKFIYLFGKIIPSMSMVISMALRFIPRYRAQIKLIIAARRGIGFDVSSGRWFSRVKSGTEILSVMVTWALENGIETGDSMLARGYGLPGRTAYSNYRFDSRDRLALSGFGVLIIVSLGCIFSGAVSVEFYIRFIMGNVQPFAGIAYACHAGVCLLPLLLEFREDVLWRSLTSRI